MQFLLKTFAFSQPLSLRNSKSLDAVQDTNFNVDWTNDFHSEIKTQFLARKIPDTRFMSLPVTTSDKMIRRVWKTTGDYERFHPPSDPSWKLFPFPIKRLSHRFLISNEPSLWALNEMIWKCWELQTDESFNILCVDCFLERRCWWIYRRVQSTSVETWKYCGPSCYSLQHIVYTDVSASLMLHRVEVPECLLSFIFKHFWLIFSCSVRCRVKFCVNFLNDLCWI